MSRTNIYRALVGVAVALIALAALAPESGASSPIPNSAVIHTRIFNDCPTSTITTTNNYPAEVSIQDNLDCVSGFANLHNWRFSGDGANPLVFNNGDGFRFCADLVISGTGQGESGLQVAPVVVAGRRRPAERADDRRRDRVLRRAAAVLQLHGIARPPLRQGDHDPSRDQVRSEQPEPVGSGDDRVHGGLPGPDLSERPARVRSGESR